MRTRKFNWQHCLSLCVTCLNTTIQSLQIEPASLLLVKASTLSLVYIYIYIYLREK